MKGNERADSLSSKAAMADICAKDQDDTMNDIRGTSQTKYLGRQLESVCLARLLELGVIRGFASNKCRVGANDASFINTELKLSVTKC